jgi:hypothetical protein
MDQLLDKTKIENCIDELLQSSINYDTYVAKKAIYEEHLILKNQINHLFNYPEDVKNYLFGPGFIPKSHELKKNFLDRLNDDWFSIAFGIREQEYDLTKKLFTFFKSNVPDRNGYYHDTLITPNGNRYKVGRFSTPTLSEMRKLAVEKKIEGSAGFEDLTTVKPMDNPIIEIEDYITRDILEKHITFPYSTIQAASQLNALEFIGPSRTPRSGITGYSDDPTQGPACALACAAGTFVRNYYYQSSESQINYLDEFEKQIKNNEKQYFTVTNGYIFINGNNTQEAKQKLKELNDYLIGLSKDEYNKLKNLIKTGLHQNVEIIFKNRFELVEQKGIKVNQVYASALSIGYNFGIEHDQNWEKFATLVLEAQYEATLLAAIKSHHHDVILTFLGGGAFQNRSEWIFNAIVTAIKEIKKIRNNNFQIILNIKLGHFNAINPDINKTKLEAALLK